MTPARMSELTIGQLKEMYDFMKAASRGMKAGSRG